MRKFCLIGETLGHSMSPQIHKRLFELSGKDGDYHINEIAKSKFSNKAKELSLYSGYNITIPYKVGIIPFIDKMDESALRYGAVNCVDNKNDISMGYNTDVYGFLKSLKVNDIPLGGKVLLLGSGGVGRMMACETSLAGGNLTIAVRDGSQKSAEAVKEFVLSKVSDAKIEIVTYDKIDGHFDTLINSTPVGMYPNVEGCPVNDKVIENCDNFFDAIYNPVQTVLIKKANAMGKNAVGGMEMLVYQAVVAHEIWDNASYLPNDIQKIIKEMQDEVERKYR